MTAKEIFELRKAGLTEQAYEAARTLYATDKSPYATSAMFWTAVDMLKMRANQDCTDEARKIYLALERLMTTVDGNNEIMTKALEKCNVILHRSETREATMNQSPEHLKMGVWGEEVAVDYLREKHYVILERDWHSGHRDIDIIARKDDTIVFIEVKTRRSDEYGDPALSVNYKKQRNLRLAINHYIKYHRLDNPIRFDVISIVGTPDSGEPQIEHIEDFHLN